MSRFNSIILLLASSGLALSSCGGSHLPVQETVDVIHYNITVAPDLSNRLNTKLYPKPVKDDDIVISLVEDFYPGIATFSQAYHKADSRKTGQQDILRVDFINQKQINLYGIDVLEMQLDLKRFGARQEDRIKYLTDKSSENLTRDKTKFKTAYQRMNAQAEFSPSGADIWSYFKEGISHETVQSTIDSVQLRDGTTKRDYMSNVLLLLTDGYIEAGLYGRDHCQGNKCYFLSSQTVQSFRKAFKQSGSNDMTAFFKDNGYGIMPVDNPLLKDLHVVVMEMYDRSKDSKGGATSHPSDWDILKLYWSDWLTQSKVKSFELLPLANSKEQAFTNIKSFLTSRK